MHEVFLCRLAAHPVFRNDSNFRVFLEYESEVTIEVLNCSIIISLSAVRAWPKQEGTRRIDLQALHSDCGRGAALRTGMIV